MATDLTTPRPDTTAPGTEPICLRPGWFALLLGAMVVVAFPKALAGLGTFFARDFGLFSYPVAYYQRECFWHGELPLWNPYNYCGIPFLAQWNTLCLYPPALIYLLLPFPWSLNFFCLLHLWFGGVGMYLLAHRWTTNRLAASVAGVVFAFNGLSLNLLVWPSHSATFSWMPWVILAVERASKEGGRKLILAAFAAALQLLAGGPETILFTWLLALGLCALEFAHRHDPVTHPAAGTRATLVRRFGFVALLALALAAVQILPFLDLAAHSQRELGFADTSGSMTGHGWANFLVPMAFGKIYPENIFLQTGQDWTSSYYLGTGALWLALLGLWSVRDRRLWFLLAAGVAALLCAFGDHTFIYPTLRRIIPQLTLMTYPVKFVIVVVFAVPLLAAFGIARAQSARRETAAPGIRTQIALGAVLLSSIAIILFWAWHSLSAGSVRSPGFSRQVAAPGSDFSLTLSSGLSRAGFLVAALLVLILLQRAGPAPRRNVISLALLALLWLDVQTHEPPQNPTVAPAVFTPGQARAELALQPQPLLGQSRVMVSRAAKTNLFFLHLKDAETEQIARRMGFFCNCNLLDDVPKVDGFFSIMPGNFTALFLALYFSPAAEFPRLADFLSVSHVTASGELTEWAPRSTWLPIVTAGQQPVFLDSAATARRLMQPDFDGSKVVFLPPETRPEVAAIHSTDARVLSLHFDRQHVEFQTTAAEPSLAVLSQTYYHWWRAYIDDQPIPLLLANYAFQAVPVPAGLHRVRLVYQDDNFRIGAIISLVAIVGCGIAWLRLREGGKPK